MVKRTGPTNDELRTLIRKLKKSKIPLWNRLAMDLTKSTRTRREVNLSRINRNTKKDEIIIVPGKVLGNGNLNHALTIAAFKFSNNALEKMKKVKAKAISINELFDSKKTGRIIG